VVLLITVVERKIRKDAGKNENDDAEEFILKNML